MNYDKKIMAIRTFVLNPMLKMQFSRRTSKTLCLAIDVC